MTCAILPALRRNDEQKPWNFMGAGLSVLPVGMKMPAGRAKKIAALVAMLARGETPHPNRKQR
jgi:hypothetical protein